MRFCRLKILKTYHLSSIWEENGKDYDSGQLSIFDSNTWCVLCRCRLKGEFSILCFWVFRFYVCWLEIIDITVLNETPFPNILKLFLFLNLLKLPKASFNNIFNHKTHQAQSPSRLFHQQNFFYKTHHNNCPSYHQGL